MKITPLEIRQKTFEKAFRGLDTEEVQGYLTSLSQEWERVLDENKELRIKLEAAEKEVEKLREVENSLFKTLKTAEDTGANMIGQAEKTAQLHLKESQIKADTLINDAQNKARNTIEEADMQARQVMEDMEEQLKSLAQAYRTLETYRDDLVSSLKTMATEVQDKVNRVTSQAKHFNPDEQIQRAKSVAQNYKFKNSTPTQKEVVVEQKSVTEKETGLNIAEVPANSEEKSFFDDFE